MTKQQSLILSIVRGESSHLSAEEVYSRAKKVMPRIGLATVYRNLTRLAELGEIRRVTLAGEPDRFDKTVINHEHAVCKRCGRMRDVDVGDIRALITDKLGENCVDYELNIHDLCPECRRKHIERRVSADES